MGLAPNVHGGSPISPMTEDDFYIEGRNHRVGWEAGRIYCAKVNYTRDRVWLGTLDSTYCCKRLSN